MRYINICQLPSFFRMLYDCHSIKISQGCQQRIHFNDRTKLVINFLHHCSRKNHCDFRAILNLKPLLLPLETQARRPGKSNKHWTRMDLNRYAHFLISFTQEYDCPYCVSTFYVVLLLSLKFLRAAEEFIKSFPLLK